MDRVCLDLEFLISGMMAEIRRSIRTNNFLFPSIDNVHEFEACRRYVVSRRVLSLFPFFFICYRMEMEMLAIDVDPQWQDKKKIYHIQM